MQIMIVNSKARQSSRENIQKSLYEVLLCCMGIVIYETTDLQEKFKTRLEINVLYTVMFSNAFSYYKMIERCGFVPFHFIKLILKGRFF